MRFNFKFFLVFLLWASKLKWAVTREFWSRSHYALKNNKKIWVSLHLSKLPI